MADNKDDFGDLEWETDEESEDLTKIELTRTFSMGRKYKNRDVKHLIRDFRHLKWENGVYRTYMKKFFNTLKIKIIGENVTIGEEIIMCNAKENVNKMESAIQEILGMSTKQALELEQLKNTLSVVQRELLSLNENDQKLMDGLNRVKEYLDAEMHPEHRSRTFATGMTELRNWSKSLPERQLHKVSFDKIPEKSKPLVYLVLAKYGNYKEILPAYFGVAGDLGMKDSKEDFITRVLAIWVYHGQRNVRHLEKVFAELEKYGLGVKEQNRAISKEDISDKASDLSGSTGTIISKGHHAEIFNLLYQIIDKQDETLKMISRQTESEQNALPIQEQHFV